MSKGPLLNFRHKYHTENFCTKVFVSVFQGVCDIHFHHIWDVVVLSASSCFGYSESDFRLWLFQKLGIGFRAFSFKESTRTSVLNCFEDAKHEILKILLTNRICFFQRPRAVLINSSSFYIFVKGNNYSENIQNINDFNQTEFPTKKEMVLRQPGRPVCGSFADRKSGRTSNIYRYICHLINILEFRTCSTTLKFSQFQEREHLFPTVVTISYEHITWIKCIRINQHC